MAEGCIYTYGRNWQHLLSFFPVLKYIPKWLRIYVLQLCKPYIMPWMVDDSVSLDIVLFPSLQNKVSDVLGGDSFTSCPRSDLSRHSAFVSGTGLAFSVLSRLLEHVAKERRLMLSEVEVAFVGADIPIARWSLLRVVSGFRFITLVGDSEARLKSLQATILSKEGIAVSVVTDRQILKKAKLIVVFTEKQEKLLAWPVLEKDAVVLVLDSSIENTGACTSWYSDFCMEWDDLVPAPLQAWYGNNELPFSVIELLLLSLLDDKFVRPRPLNSKYCEALTRVFISRFANAKIQLC